MALSFNIIMMKIAREDIANDIRFVQVPLSRGFGRSI
jgi:hypothetical protein